MTSMSGYDPLELSDEIEKKVVRGDRRKYYRFRKARFYGGIATGDCVGCNLSCHFCWSKKPRRQPGQVGEFHSPEKVKEKLADIAERNDLLQVRLSGNEPTIGREHLISLLEELEGSGLKFILETNGILLGEEPDYARELDKFGDVHVRVSLKGCDAEQFSKLTGARPEGFKLQIESLRNLVNSGVSCHASIVEDFAGGERLSSLKNNLQRIDPGLARGLEFESLILYPHVRKQLERAGISIPSDG